MLTHGSAFAGIGGFDLGFERAGIETVWQVEIDDYCRRVLAKHFPHAQRFSDIRECCGISIGTCHDEESCERKHHLPKVDILSGGFPCPDISEAGQRMGIEGERSGLWKEYFRIIRELRPRFAVVENVSALLERDMGRVLGDLSSIGYDAEWELISACSIGAPHTRERVFIVAYPESHGRRQCWRVEQQKDSNPQRDIPQWPNQSEPLRVAARISHRMDRLRGCGNSILPQIAEWLGRVLVAA